MMMRHLLLDSIERFDEFGKIPVFIPLKDYGDSYDSLLNYIYPSLFPRVFLCLVLFKTKG